MTKPTLHDWVVGEKITAGLLDALAAAITYAIDGQPRVAVYDNTGVACPDATTTLIPFTNEATGSDTDDMWSTGFPSRVYINTTGWYHFEAFVSFASGPTFTALNINLRLNAGGSSAGGSSLRNHAFGAGQSAARLTLERAMSAGDYVEMFVTQTSSGSRTTQTGNNVTGITCHRFGG